MTVDQSLSFNTVAETGPGEVQTFRHHDDIAGAEDDLEPIHANDRLISIVALSFVALVIINLLCVPVVAVIWLITHLGR